MSSDVKPVSFYAYNETMRERNEARAEVERLRRERDALRALLRDLGLHVDAMEEALMKVDESGCVSCGGELAHEQDCIVMKCRRAALGEG